MKNQEIEIDYKENGRVVSYLNRFLFFKIKKQALKTGEKEAEIIRQALRDYFSKESNSLSSSPYPRKHTWPQLH